MKYVICKTINKYLSSNLTSLKSFIEMEDMSTLKQTNKKQIIFHSGGFGSAAYWWSDSQRIAGATDAIRKTRNVSFFVNLCWTRRKPFFLFLFFFMMCVLFSTTTTEEKFLSKCWCNQNKAVEECHHEVS